MINHSWRLCKRGVNNPFEIGEYLVTRKDGTVHASVYVPSVPEWRDLDGHKLDWPIAWMPMPEPYRSVKG